MRKFVIGETVRCTSIVPLRGNIIAPPLELKKEYPILSIAYDKEGNQHLDVGLVSKYAYIRSYETEEDLPNGDTIHWCHPIRFE